MGYYISFAGSDLSIPAANVGPCIDAIQKHVADEHLHSVSEGSILKACAKGDLAGVFDEFGFYAFADDAGNLEINGYNGEKYYGEMGEIFAMVAPFVAGECSVEFEGESMDMFRFHMKDGKCYEESAHIEVIWPEEPKEADLVRLE